MDGGDTSVQEDVVVASTEGLLHVGKPPGSTSGGRRAAVVLMVGWCTGH
jgi:hypothetical protein